MSEHDVLPIAWAQRTLDDDERSRLTSLEATIERGFETFVEVGHALHEISAARLYRQDFDSFEAYCRVRWSMGRHKARRLISAALTFSAIESRSRSLVTNGTSERERVSVPLPANEWQMRALTKLPSEQAHSAWELAVASSEHELPTAPEVERAVETITGGRRNGAVDKSREAVAQRVELAKQMAAEGYSSKQIAPAIGVSLSSFGNFRRRHGVDVPADKITAGHRQHDSTRIVTETVSTLEGLVMGLRLADVDDVDRALVDELLRSLNESMRELTRFRSLMRGVVRHDEHEHD